MSRSGYSDDGGEGFELWRGSVARALRGKRGQTALVDLINALDRLPTKELIGGSFSRDGCACPLAVLAAARGVYVGDLETRHEEDPVERDVVGGRLNIAPAMAAEVMYMNDEATPHNETRPERWVRMRAWAMCELLVGNRERVKA